MANPRSILDASMVGLADPPHSLRPLLDLDVVWAQDSPPEKLRDSLGLFDAQLHDSVIVSGQKPHPKESEQRVTRTSAMEALERDLHRRKGQPQSDIRLSDPYNVTPRHHIFKQDTPGSVAPTPPPKDLFMSPASEYSQVTIPSRNYHRRSLSARELIRVFDDADAQLRPSNNEVSQVAGQWPEASHNRRDQQASTSKNGSTIRRRSSLSISARPKLSTSPRQLELLAPSCTDSENESQENGLTGGKPNSSNSSTSLSSLTGAVIAPSTSPGSGGMANFKTGLHRVFEVFSGGKKNDLVMHELVDTISEPPVTDAPVRDAATRHVSPKTVRTGTLFHLTTSQDSWTTCHAVLEPPFLRITPNLASQHQYSPLASTITRIFDLSTCHAARPVSFSSLGSHAPRLRLLDHDDGRGGYDGVGENDVFILELQEGASEFFASSDASEREGWLHDICPAIPVHEDLYIPSRSPVEIRNGPESATPRPGAYSNVYFRTSSFTLPDPMPLQQHDRAYPDLGPHDSKPTIQGTYESSPTTSDLFNPFRNAPAGSQVLSKFRQSRPGTHASHDDSAQSRSSSSGLWSGPLNSERCDSTSEYTDITTPISVQSGPGSMKANDDDKAPDVTSFSINSSRLISGSLSRRLTSPDPDEDDTPELSSWRALATPTLHTISVIPGGAVSPFSRRRSQKMLGRPPSENEQLIITPTAPSNVAAGPHAMELAAQSKETYKVNRSYIPPLELPLLPSLSATEDPVDPIPEAQSTNPSKIDSSKPNPIAMTDTPLEDRRLNEVVARLYQFLQMSSSSIQANTNKIAAYGEKLEEIVRLVRIGDGRHPPVHQTPPIQTLGDLPRSRNLPNDPSYTDILARIDDLSRQFVTIPLLSASTDSKLILEKLEELRLQQNQAGRTPMDSNDGVLSDISIRLNALMQVMRRIADKDSAASLAIDNWTTAMVDDATPVISASILSRSIASSQRAPSAGRSSTMVSQASVFSREVSASFDGPESSADELQYIITLLDEERQSQASARDAIHTTAQYLHQLNQWMERFSSKHENQMNDVGARVAAMQVALGHAAVSAKPPATSKVISEDDTSQFTPDPRPTTLFSVIAELKREMVDMRNSLAELEAGRQPMETLIHGLRIETARMNNDHHATVSGMLEMFFHRQREEHEQLIRSIAGELAEEIRGQRIRFVEAMRDATAVNLEHQIHKFKEQLSKEVVGMEKELTDLFAMRHILKTKGSEEPGAR
ncbi:hypothetical protein DL93DRAFT_2071914 [Clavulina sp. PMI_390]|nr:hypothetical protein DL93DRAFT_2071914 [Clavulina sp. PMI_390]